MELQFEARSPNSLAWTPIDTETAIRWLTNSYHDVDAVLDYLKSQRPDGKLPEACTALGTRIRIKQNSTRYTFHQVSRISGPHVIVTITQRRPTGYRTKEVELTPATYRRFTRLANSGRYDVSISEDTDGVAWELARRPAVPSAIAF